MMLAWKQMQYAPKPELQRLADFRLHEFVNNQLYPFSTFYRKLFTEHKIDPLSIRTVSDLRRVPFSSKTDLIATDANPQKSLDFVLRPDEALIRKYWGMGRKLSLLWDKIRHGPEYVEEKLGWEYRPIFLTATTGRTYQPVSFLYTHQDIDNLRVGGSRLLNIYGVKPGSRCVSLFPYAPHLAFWAVCFGAMAAGVLAVSTGGGKVMGTSGNIGFIERLKPYLIAGIPGYMYHLLRTAQAQGADMSSVRLVALGAEKVPPGLRERMHELLTSMGAKDPNIFGTYGFTEAKMAWGECPTKLGVYSGYHVYPDLEIFEIVNPETGEPVAEGEGGEIVYSSIDGRGSVVFRYRTGDFSRGGMTWEPCPHCGRTLPRISSDITRVSNVKTMQFSKIKGTLVNLNNLAFLLSDLREIEEWQVEIRKKDDDPLEMDVLVVHLALRNGVDQASFEQKLREAIVREIEVSANELHFCSLEEVLGRLGMETELKEKRIVDSRPK
ncbi:MAG: AMP-binding protein [Candidatus Riflebacteria bacterium]|nr:AMP-binding protein [Candidatus Riflebacteria bacterium]